MLESIRNQMKRTRTDRMYRQPATEAKHTSPYWLFYYFGNQIAIVAFSFPLLGRKININQKRYKKDYGKERAFATETSSLSFSFFFNKIQIHSNSIFNINEPFLMCFEGSGRRGVETSILITYTNREMKTQKIMKNFNLY